MTRGYLGLFRMRLIRGLAYRTAALAGVATQFFWGFVIVMVLQAFARAGGSPLSPGQIASYIWLQQAFLALVVVWFRDKELVALIVSGDSAYELCRPADAYILWFARLAAGRVAAAALRCGPILLVAALLPEPYRLHAPASVAAGLAFASALALGLLLIVAITMFAYVLCLVALSPNAPFMLAAPFFELASGMVVPLPFMPPGVRAVLEALPFRLCVDLPFRLYSGSIPAAQAPVLLALQAAWLLALIPLGRAVLGRALRGAQSAGG
jgi:ABC-2 type transport system permease protein